MTVEPGSETWTIYKWDENGISVVKLGQYANRMIAAEKLGQYINGMKMEYPY
jgi:hypothetical protein